MTYKIKFKKVKERQDIFKMPEEKEPAREEDDFKIEDTKKSLEEW